ncbi:MAG: hypothetical protein GY771_11875, partial [bacterium]|nr:hypothetical protein [bacterium]
MFNIKITALLSIAVIFSAVAFADTDTFHYYDDYDTGYWNLPAADDYYVQAFDPRDFAIGWADYEIIEIGVWTNGSNPGSSGSGPCKLFLLYLPDKESSPEGIPESGDLPGQNLYWVANDDALNLFGVNWSVPGGQCIGLGIVGEPPWIDDFVICMDSGPSDTADWEYFAGEWLDLATDEGYDMDSPFHLMITS